MSKRTTASVRRAGDDSPDSADPSLPLKKRARQRLVGAVVICASAAISLPFVLDAEPRRPAPELAVVMPPTESAARAAAAGSTMSGRVEGARESQGNVLSAARAAAEVDDGALAAQSAPTDHPVGTHAEEGKPSESKTIALVPKSTDTKSPAAASKAVESKASTKPPESRTTTTAAKPAESKPAAPSPRTTDAKSTASASKTTDAKSPEARSAPSKSGEGRYLLQVGAYSGEAGANAAVERLKGMGLKAYTERIKTDAGEKIRVRVGPFSTREAADQARSKLQSSGVQAALIAPASTR